MAPRRDEYVDPQFYGLNLASAVANVLEKRGIAVLTVAEADLLGTNDEDLLEFVREEMRVIVTQDRDFL